MMFSTPAMAAMMAAMMLPGALPAIMRSARAGHGGRALFSAPSAARACASALGASARASG
jgi:hypothetical protein